MMISYVDFVPFLLVTTMMYSVMLFSRNQNSLITIIRANFCQKVAILSQFFKLVTSLSL